MRGSSTETEVWSILNPSVHELSLVDYHTQVSSYSYSYSRTYGRTLGHFLPEDTILLPSITISEIHTNTYFSYNIFFKFINACQLTAGQLLCNEAEDRTQYLFRIAWDKFTLLSNRNITESSLKDFFTQIMYKMIWYLLGDVKHMLIINFSFYSCFKIDNVSHSIVYYKI